MRQVQLACGRDDSLRWVVAHSWNCASLPWFPTASGIGTCCALYNVQARRLRRRRTIDFQIGCTLEYEVPQPTAFVFLVEAARLDRQIVRSERLHVTPDLEEERFTAPESGNRYLRVQARPGKLQLVYEAAVTLRPRVVNPAEVGETPAERLPISALVHLNPSHYCQSDRLTLFAQRTFGHLAPGHARVAAVCAWICDNVDYVSGSTDEMTSAADTLVERRGVCRDFAHLAIALVRALGIPARYVSAYAWRLSPPDFHAVFEAYLTGPSGGAWYLFDATRRSALDGIVRIGVGRDAGDVSFCSQFGEAKWSAPQVWIHGPDVGSAPLTTQAVATDAM